MADGARLQNTYPAASACCGRLQFIELKTMGTNYQTHSIRGQSKFGKNVGGGKRDQSEHSKRAAD
jgi:hypothetical protein